MANIQYSQVIDRPVDKVFQFIAVDHVRNHPRWDPNMELWLDSEEPIGVGTIIHRRNKRSGTPVDGTMEFIEFDTNHAIEAVIRDGSTVMNSRMTFEPIGENQTKVTIDLDIPSMDEPAHKSYLIGQLELAGQKRKQLIESET